MDSLIVQIQQPSYVKVRNFEYLLEYVGSEMDVEILNKVFCTPKRKSILKMTKKLTYKKQEIPLFKAIEYPIGFF